MICDAHAHIHPENYDGGNEWKLIFAECRKNGVTHGVFSSVDTFVYYPSAGCVRNCNRLGKEFMDHARDKLNVIWLAYLNPQLDNWEEELNRCLQDGAKGIKLWISLKSPDGSLDRCRRVLAAAETRRLPVLFHTFNRTGGNRPGEISVAECVRLAREFPATSFIAGHAGGNWRHSLGLGRTTPNVYLDVCGTAPEKGMVEALVADWGETRVLFGSDMPTRNLASQLAKVIFADVSEETMKKILWDNAANIFGLKGGAGINHMDTNLRPMPGMPDGTVDHFCFSGHWPFFPTAGATPNELDAELAKYGVKQAFCADLGSIYRQDLSAANATFLAATCGCERIRPLATVNPNAENWEAVLEHVSSSFAGIILHPYLQNWRLNDMAYDTFFRACSEHSIPLWINCVFAEYRFRHGGISPRPVTTEELLEFTARAPRNNYVFQGLSVNDAAAVLRFSAPVSEGRIQFVISRMSDLTGHLQRILVLHGKDSLVMGSEFPLRDLRTVRWSIGTGIHGAAAAE